MQLASLNRAELFAEIADLARDQGVNSQEMWNELAEEVIESHLALGELDKDQDLVMWRETLQGMWDEYKREAEQEAGAMVHDQDLEGKPDDVA